MYGLSEPTEFLNEAIANIAFYDRLKGKGIWDKIKKWGTTLL
jgi:hypothetical protein